MKLSKLLGLVAATTSTLFTIQVQPAFAQDDSGTFFDAIPANIVGLFPLTNTDYTSRTQVGGKMYETLLTRDDDTYEFKPLLANKWETSKDGKQFTFWIDPKAKFWDGSPVTAEDVKFSYDIIFMPEVNSAAVKPYYSSIDKVEILAPNQIRFTVKDVYYKNFDTVAELYVFQKKFYSELYKKDKTMAKAESNKTAMLTGKWMLEKWDDNQRIILKRNPNYWNKEVEQKEGRWNYDRIYFKVIPETSVEFETFKKGELTYTGLTPKQWALQSDGPEWKSKLVKVKTINKAPVAYSFIGWNNKHPILGDKNVRWALSHLVNMPVWIKKFDFNLSEPAISSIGPKAEEHDPKLKPVPFDLAAARKRLADAGWKTAGSDGFLVKDGKKFEITIIYPTQSKESIEPKLTEYKNQAAKVGVSILLKAVEWTSFTKLLDDRNFDGVTLVWTRDVDQDEKQIWHSASIADKGSNFISFNNPQADKLIDEHRRTMDRKKRIELARQFEHILYEEQPYTFLTERKFALYAHQNYVVKPKDTFNYTIGTSYWKLRQPPK